MFPSESEFFAEVILWREHAFVCLFQLQLGSTGYGYLSEYVVERLWRDAKLLEIGGGTLEAHQKNITKDLTRRLDVIR
jgi:alkylation response protein AidB-like acyl-CoA dehydrogenase